MLVGFTGLGGDRVLIRKSDIRFIESGGRCGYGEYSKIYTYRGTYYSVLGSVSYVEQVLLNSEENRNESSNGN